MTMRDQDYPEEGPDGAGAGFGRVEQLFAQALERDPSTWPGFLAAVEPEGLREEVAALLRSHGSTSGPLACDDNTTDWLRDALQDMGSSPKIPERIGPHRIEGELGRGGMGVVYRGVTDGEGYQRPVAVKVLQGTGLGSLWLATPEMHRRFAAERRILARLQHPNIAALIDGGSTEEGTPWLAMELVDGDDLITHARERDLTLRQRLVLFRKVCDAVAHAHASLVVHRDLKPGNVLVTREGEPKLLDFGIAKLLEDTREGGGAAETGGTVLALTETGSHLFTPDYSSPEQISGAPVTTRTDVHALGLLLYELMTDVRAQRVQGKAPAELVAEVCERMPIPPSSHGHPELRGDLDAIALRALAREPERRYGSAQELADDLGRWLRGLPVRARRDTFHYRAGKFIGRHRMALASAVLVFLGTLAAAVALYRQSEQLAEQAQSLEQQAQSLVRERNAAQRESRVSTEIAGLMVGIFELPDVEASRARSLTAMDLMDIARRRVVEGDGRSSDPLMQASLLDALGRAYTSLKSLDKAEPLLQEALELRLASPEARPLELSQSHWALGRLRILQERLEEADQLLIAAEQDIAKEDLSGQPIRWANMPLSIAFARATVAETRNDIGAAKEHLKRAETLFPQAPEESAQARATWLMARAGLSFQEGNLEEGIGWAEEAIRLRSREFGDEHPQVAQVLRLRGGLLKELGRYEDALADFRRAVELEAIGLGTDHAVVDDGRYGLAQLLRDLERLDEAEALIRGVLERDRARFGRHPSTAMALGLLGNILGAKGLPEEGETHLRESVAILREHADESGEELANAISNLGVLYLESGRVMEVEPLLQEALELRLGFLAEGHPDLLTSYSLLALFYFNTRQIDRAEEMYRRVHDGRVAALGDHPETAGAIYSLGAVAKARGDMDGAIARYTESAEMYRRVLPAGHPETTLPLFALGALYAQLQRFNEAVPVLEEALATRLEAYPETHPEVAGVRRYLGRCYSFDPARGADAARHYRAALESMAAHRGPDGELPEWGPFRRLDLEADAFFRRIGQPDLVDELLRR